MWINRGATMNLDQLRLQISEQAKPPSLASDIREYNHFIVDCLSKSTPLAGATMLDLGASSQGFALEAALAHGVRVYEGVNIDIAEHWGNSIVEFPGQGSAIGRLRQMRAEKLEFGDAEFDCIMTVSTFEHFLEPAAVLAEMFRVLKPGGVALVNFEPVWSWAHGAHLHHFGQAVAGAVPPWSHLITNEESMRRILARSVWPDNAPVSREETLEWIYRSQHLNRLTVRALKTIFQASSFETVWWCDLRDAVTEEFRAIADYVSTLVPLTSEELLCRGCSVLLRRPAA
jgi:ubiquinone/menaquinone biosynthesis C-methylase UbiE